MSTSDESGKRLLPEGCSICQYRPDISAIIVNKQSRARPLLAHPVSVHFKNKKKHTVDFENNHFKINQKAL